MTLAQEVELNPRDFQRFRELIFDLAGISLSESKLFLVQSRLAKRLRARALNDYSEYLDYLQNENHRDELIHFINSLTTNKTEFFREPHHFEFLTETVFPELERRASEGGERNVRIWSSASSTGEEPYSIAMCAADYFSQRAGWDIRVLATDIDTSVLATAATGVYPETAVDQLPPSYRHKYLSRHRADGESKWTITDSIKRFIHFHRVNLNAQQWPFTAQCDAIFCRNVMIYFNKESLIQLIDRFTHYLRPDGYLMIGHSESLFGVSDRFQLLGDTVYQLKPLTNGEPISPPLVAKQPSVSPATTPSRPSSCETPATPTRRTKRPGPNHRRPLREIIAEEEQVTIIVGEVFASCQPVWISTLLGSCVSVCLFDENQRVGGMNHFMLPERKGNGPASSSFGVHAMELLINEIMRLRGDRRRLKAKLFGGARVLSSSTNEIGDQNIVFAHQFLETENIPIIAEHTGGNRGMRVNFNSTTFKVYLHELDSSTSRRVEMNELSVSQQVIDKQMRTCDVTLF